MSWLPIGFAILPAGTELCCATTFGGHSLKCIPLENTRHCIVRTILNDPRSGIQLSPNRNPHAVGFPCQLRSFPAWTIVVSERSVDGIPHRHWHLVVCPETEMNKARLRVSCEYRDNPCRASSGQLHPGSITSGRSGTHPSCSKPFRNNNGMKTSILIVG
ncbi:hypothetical protein EDB83DRAFT_423283 [Lactarius deliciosus]|nr:hypothetical protein EDB83DRAFT_423283 [Lactarius deliciosus]